MGKWTDIVRDLAISTADYADYDSRTNSDSIIIASVAKLPWTYWKDVVWNVFVIMDSILLSAYLIVLKMAETIAKSDRSREIWTKQTK